MPLIAKDNGGRDFAPTPQGTHIAVANLIADLGVQPGGRYKPRHQIYIRWEIPAERIEWVDRDGKLQRGPAQIGKAYTLSLSTKAKLRGDLENWRGRPFTDAELAGFDIFKVLGAACQIMVQHQAGADGRTYANVTGIMGLPRGVAKPAAERPLVKYSPDEPDQFDELPQWLQDKVRDSVSAPPVETVSRDVGDQDFDDDIPF